jgi:hypothetical protein
VASLGASEQLLRRWQRGELSRAAFARACRGELFRGAGIDSRNRTIKNHGQKFLLRLPKELARSGDVTLLCHCAEGEPHCHRRLWRSLILGKRI